jgi:collagenase-like PrtC family protease
LPSFSIPADFQTSTIEQISKKNEKWEIPVKDVYGTLNPSIFGSGRTSSLLRPIKFDILEKYVKTCNQNGITFSYPLNFNCTGNMEFTDKGKKEIAQFLRKLDSIGIKKYTTVLPSMIELLNQVVPEAKVAVSVISNVDSVSLLKMYTSSKNVNRIMLPEYMNRKIAKMEKLISYGKKLGVDFGTIVNVICLIDCPFRSYHYAFSSHGGKSKDFKPQDYYSTRCTYFKLNNPEEVMKMGWIRPEDLKKYVDIGISVFKIAGREIVNPDFIKTVDIYNQGSYDGNLWELLRCFSTPSNSSEVLNYSKVFSLNNKDLGQFTKRFFEAKSFCSTKDCETCNYCNANSQLVHVNDYDRWKQALDKELSLFKSR